MVDVNRSNVRFPDVLSSTPILCSTRQNFNLQSYHLQPGSTTEVCLNHHVIGVNVGPAINCRFKLDGRTHRFPVLPGEMNLVPEGHCFEAAWQQPTQSMTLNISTALLSRTALALWDDNQFELLPNLQFQDPFVTQLALAVSQELNNPNPNSMYIDIMGNTLAAHLLQRFSNRRDSKEFNKKHSAKGELSHKKLTSVFEYIEAHIGLSMTVKGLAEVAGISQYHFSRAFKRSTGLSPHQYILKQRIIKAKQLLLQKDMRISDIALICGFNSQSHLNRHFKGITGVTPTKFRSQ